MPGFYSYQSWRAPFYFASGNRTDYARPRPVLFRSVTRSRLIPQPLIVIPDPFEADGEGAAYLTPSLSPAALLASGVGEASLAAAVSVVMAAGGEGGASLTVTLVPVLLAQGVGAAFLGAAIAPSLAAAGVGAARLSCAVSVAMRAEGVGTASCTLSLPNEQGPAACLRLAARATTRLVLSASPAAALVCTARATALLVMRVKVC